MTKNNSSLDIGLSSQKKRGLILAIGSVTLCLLYLGYLFFSSKTGIATTETNGIATLLFVILYISFFVIVKTAKTGFWKKHKRLLLNIPLLLTPMAIAFIIYIIFKSFLAALFVFMLGQIMHTVYYNNFYPVPGFKKAFKLYKTQNYKTAKEVLNTINNLHPENFDVLFLTGIVCIRDLDYKNAIYSLEKAKTLNPEDPVVYINLSNAYIAIENYDKAIENANKTLTISEENWSSYYSIGLCNLLKEDYKEAINSFKKVLSFELPAMQRFLVHYGMGKAYLCNKIKDSAEEEFANAIKFCDNNTASFWKTQLREIENNPNKPSLFVKEALDYVLEKNQS